MDSEEVIFLSQLLHSMKKASEKLEIFYNNRDYENFELVKKEISAMQKKIEEILK